MKEKVATIIFEPLMDVSKERIIEALQIKGFTLISTDYNGMKVDVAKDKED